MSETSSSARINRDSVLRERHGEAVLVTFNRPHSRNAIDQSLVGRLHEELDELEGHSSAAQAVVFSGAGGAFCSGADLKMRAGMSAKERVDHSLAIKVAFNRISGLSVPTIAVVDGPAMGAGCELALACDMRIASDVAVFGLPETRLGVFPGAGGTQRLARLVGPARAKEIIFLGEWIDASEALRIGLVNRLARRDRLVAMTREILDTLSARAPLAVAAAKRAIDTGLEHQLETALMLESDLLDPLFATEDYNEGLAAFAERRPPRFRGC